jgi:4-amino-4-deoxy-L-arabinose transferase-like glycosyltransferase
MTDRRWLITILVISVVLRLIAVFAMGNTVDALPGISDQQSYDALAQRVLGGYGFAFASDWWPATRAGQPTAHWSYLYTLYLVGIYALVGAQALFPRILQAIFVGLIWPLLIFRMGRRVADQRAGLIAAAWTAVYGYFIYYSAALMTEAFYITAILCVFNLALTLAGGGLRQRNWLLLGLSLGVAVLLRQLFLLFIPFLLVWLMWQLAGKSPIPKTVARMAMALAVVAAMIAPFTLRNAQAFHRFVLLNTNSGYALFFGNHPIYGVQFQAVLTGDVGYGDLIPPDLKPLDEAALEQALMGEAVKIILADPARYIQLSLSRVPIYFQFWPSADSALFSNIVRSLSFGVALPFMLIGLWMARRSWRRWSLLYLFIAVYTLIHLLSWALIRYRLPVDAILLIFAALPIAKIFSGKRPSATAL